MMHLHGRQPPTRPVSASAARPVISLNHVTKRYELYDNSVQEVRNYLGMGAKGVRQKVALDAINLTIAHGERVGVVGHNGSGKTTLLRIICGTTRPSEGTIKIDGTVQALMQTGFGFSDELNGLDNIHNALVYNDLPDDALAQAEADIIDFVELGEFLRHPIKTYSLGMRARLEFATATAIRPSVLAIDEVLSAGDGYFVHKCAERMRKLVSGTTLLLVSHALDQIREYCERTLWLDGGHLREDGPTEQVLDHYRDYMLALAAKLDTPPTVQSLETGAAAATRSTKEIFLERAHALIEPTDLHGHAIIQFEFGDQERRLKVMESGDALELRLTLCLARPLKPVVLGFSSEGSLLFELDGGAALPAGKHHLRLHQPRLGIGVGTYVLMAALREPDYPDGAVHTLGADLLNLQMAPTNWSEPPMVHMDGEWTSGAARTPLQSKLTAWV
ncbi:MAG: Teichoic acids export ATP-binding protein TagH [Candidatus Accumulibacter regalis]|jgi:ABC-type polysaccharide/polyol phosphate transport system, ATPase component|uniref:Teichoic acids export ATP-binding protein TagH n=1 Tax=Accumulibacter regalis TaxID=522306 RepID=A0A011QE44_ACCRE|nr:MULTISPECIES: ATP-binding cassette domain-containing protein [unclassified Candidatus Accumulibacter]EXI87380.1 MAG: Teichoic acids export ATP-binding protein TagH [Candidatus Accumulibacter regalis]MBL8368304.1 ATP-binding cassette domain-containing protein [Accumulibacter sp.]HRE72433.1 ATP-binding cassette domain-containing protein [Accumulibacter sp.]